MSENNITEKEVILITSRLLRATIATEFMRVIKIKDAETIRTGVSVPTRPISIFSNAGGSVEEVAPGYQDNQAVIDARFLRTAEVMNKLIGCEIPSPHAWQISGLLGQVWGSRVGLRPYREAAIGLWREEEQGTLQMVVAMSKKQQNHVLVTGYTTRYEHLFQEQPRKLHVA